MCPTNNAYDNQSSKSISGEYSSNPELILSLHSLKINQTRQISDQSNIHLLQNFDNMSISTIEKNSFEHRLDDISIQQQMSNTDDDNNNLSEDTSYYSLTHILDKRHGHRDDDSHLSRGIRAYYKDQDTLIDDYERVYNGGSEKINNELERLKRHTNILTKVSLGANIILFILQIVAAAISKSLSVVSTVIDSAVDLGMSIILFWAWRAIRRRDPYHYPQGRTRLEPVSIVILSVLMCGASVLIIYQSIDTIVHDSQYFTQQNITQTLREIDMTALPISVMVVTIVSKIILFILCNRIKTPTTSALSTEHISEAASNIVALFCGLIGSFAYKNKINQKAIVVDPIGAILISISIIIIWIRQARGQVKRLSGYTADPKFLSQLTWLTYHHSPLITKIDTVRACHFGTAYFAEVDIVLPESMPLKEAHDIGEELQKKIEELPEVERAFVHLDYDCDHHPSIEHKRV